MYKDRTFDCFKQLHTEKKLLARRAEADQRCDTEQKESEKQ